MRMTDVHALVNSATQEIMGETGIITEDLKNVVDVGSELLDMDNAYDHYVKSLLDHIGRVKFVDRAYTGVAPSLMMDSWEYGSIMEKIHGEMPDAVEDPSWNLVDKTTYNQDVFHQPVAHAKFFNMRTSYLIEHSVAYRQVKESFSSASQLNAFLSMLVNQVNKGRQVRNDAMVFRALNAGIAETIKDANGNRVVNLLAGYNSEFGTSLTAAQAMHTEAFLRYAIRVISIVAERLRGLTTIYNIGGTQKFTPSSEQTLIWLSEFKSAAEVYLYSGLSQFNTEGIRMNAGQTVPYWQGLGDSPAFSTVSTINVAPPSGGAAVTQTGIVACLFDREAVGVVNPQFEVTTHDNAKARFVNYFYHQDAGYFFDGNENFVVFIVA